MAPKMFCSSVSLLLVFLAIHQPFTVHSRVPTSTNPGLTYSLQVLEGALKGQTKQGIGEVKRYLKAFGYLDYEDDVELMDDRFDETLESALKSYQKFSRLEVTGELDASTVKHMSVPRCGVPDFVRPSHANRSATEPNKLHIVSRYRFNWGMSKWPPSRTHFTYAFNTMAKDVSPSDLRAAFWSAFQSWTHVTRFTFSEVPTDQSPDITIGFYSGYHGDSMPFDGPGFVLAHSAYPTTGMSHYDNDESWSVNPSSTQTDLESVVLHEVGHVLGLAHTDDQNAVMFASIPAGVAKRVLQQDDIDGIHALYS